MEGWSQVLAKKLTITWDFLLHKVAASVSLFPSRARVKCKNHLTGNVGKRVQTLNRLKYRISLKC